jgi:hypothetical protein
MFFNYAGARIRLGLIDSKISGYITYQLNHLKPNGTYMYQLI